MTELVECIVPIDVASASGEPNDPVDVGYAVAKAVALLKAQRVILNCEEYEDELEQMWQAELIGEAAEGVLIALAT